MKEAVFLIKDFFGGQVRDEKSQIAGVASNVEEVDIFSNGDYIQAEQIMSDDFLPANTEVYSFCSGDDDTIYGYGKELTTGKVRIISVANGGANNPGSFSVLFTSTDATNLATKVSGFEFMRSGESVNPVSVYYIKGTGSNWYIARYNIGAAAEQRWTGTTWSATGVWDSNSKLSGLSGSFMRPTIKRFFNDLYIAHGQYIAKITDDSGATFTEKKFTLPNEWECVDFTVVANLMIILARNKNRNINETRLFWWNMSSTTKYEDFTQISTGGAQWIYNHNETIKIFCAKNGAGYIYQLTTPYRGGIPIRLPNIEFRNLPSETSLQPISPTKGVAVKDGILYFTLWKTDKTGIYALGKIDDLGRPIAVLLSKRFAVTNYATHTPYALYILGSNFYSAFDDNGTAKMSRCATLNNPNRSSNAVWESTWLDFGRPQERKDVTRISIMSKPLPIGTDVDVFLATNYNDSYTELKRNNGTSFNTENGTLANFSAGTVGAGIKAAKLKLLLKSNGVNSPKIQGISFLVQIKDELADD